VKTNKLIALAATGYSFLVKAASYLQSPVLLVIRLYWGWSFFQTGLGKLQNLERTTAYFRDDLNLPLPALNAAMAGTVECYGGMLLLVGLASRLTAIPLIVTMVVAYLTADIDVVKNIFSEPDKFTAADPFLFLLTAVLVLAFGPGVFSLDHLIGRKLRSLAGKAPGQAEADKPFAHGSARVIAH
jgi:putative oxidoreductase